MKEFKCVPELLGISKIHCICNSNKHGASPFKVTQISQNFHTFYHNTKVCSTLWCFRLDFVDLNLLYCKVLWHTVSIRMLKQQEYCIQSKEKVLTEQFFNSKASGQENKLFYPQNIPGPKVVHFWVWRFSNGTYVNYKFRTVWFKSNLQSNSDLKGSVIAASVSNAVLGLAEG